jgi:hypothetical protein
VAQRVNGAVKGVQAAGAQAIRDRFGAQAGVEQLRARNDPVLPRGQPSELRLDWSGHFGSNIEPN